MNKHPFHSGWLLIMQLKMGRAHFTNWLCHQLTKSCRGRSLISHICRCMMQVTCGERRTIHACFMTDVWNVNVTVTESQLGTWSFFCFWMVMSCYDYYYCSVVTTITLVTWKPLSLQHILQWLQLSSCHCTVLSLPWMSCHDMSWHAVPCRFSVLLFQATPVCYNCVVITMYSRCCHNDMLLQYIDMYYQDTVRAPPLGRDLVAECLHMPQDQCMANTACLSSTTVKT